MAKEIVADEMIVSGSMMATDGVTDAAGIAVADAVETTVSTPAA